MDRADRRSRSCSYMPGPAAERVYHNGEPGLGGQRSSAIPLTFFFFGTLMDQDVLELVLERPVAPQELLPARLSGYRRVRAREAPYPLLIPHATGVVNGRLLHPRKLEDEARITWFEEDEYREQWHPVRLEDDRVVRARVFLARSCVTWSTASWRFEIWQRTEKRHFLALCESWMRDYPR